MPTQVRRINLLDLQKNIAVGVALPFNQPGVFKSTFSTKDQIKSNLINLLLTNKGERIFNPEFGADLNTALFEGITDQTSEGITNLINDSVRNFIPEIEVTSVNFNTDLTDQNKISISVSYIIRLSGTSDQVTIEFI
jgi:phage baseplate assembly protein W